jgi:hypothetical protein
MHLMTSPGKDKLASQCHTNRMYSTTCQQCLELQETVQANAQQSGSAAQQQLLCVPPQARLRSGPMLTAAP